MGGMASVVSDRVLDEQSLIEGAQADPTRFAELYETNVAAVFGHIYRRCGNRSVAEDVTSEVFFRALRALPRFEWRGVPYIGYLRRIADNLLADTMNRGRRDLEVQALREEPTIDAVDFEDQLLSMVARLPDDQRLVLGLRFAEDQSIAQVAVTLGRSEGAVKQLQHRAIATLRTWIAAQPLLEDS